MKPTQRLKQKPFFFVHFRFGPPLLALAISGLFAVGLVLFAPQVIHFSYGGNNCVGSLTLLPQLDSTAPTGEFQIIHKDPIKLGSTVLLTRKSCIEANRAPQPQKTTQLAQTLGRSVIVKSFYISTGQLANVVAARLPRTVAVNDTAQIALSTTDTTFRYQLRAGKRTSDCIADRAAALRCKIAPLGLGQGKSYTIAIERQFTNEMPTTVTQWSMITASPVAITGTTLPPNTVIYDRPSSFTLTANKALRSAKVQLIEAASGKSVSQTTEVAGATVTIKLLDQLPRKTNFILIVKEASAEDRGQLDGEYSVAFATSGGPRVISVNLPSSNVAQNQSVILTFDQALAQQDMSKLLGWMANGTPVGFQSTIDGNRVTLRPTAALPFCGKLALSLSAGVRSQYDISGDSAWGYQSRVICYVVTTIGYSVQGRAIQAWQFGSGGSSILYQGVTHGNERGTKSLMDTWIADLRAHPDKVPAGHTVFVIPMVNPDGYAANTRTNAHNVDLNRNFPTGDWKSDVKMPSGEVLVGGGGSSPLSEPESQALAGFVRAQRPRLVLTYHSQASLVSPNEAGDSAGLAQNYSGLSGYRYVAAGETDSVFHYDTTGAFEDWLPQLGIPALLIELATQTQSEFSRNQNAMWVMAGV